MSLKRKLHLFVGGFTLILAASLPGRAQVQNVTDTTSTPVPGVGHNYLGMLNEAVDPANGGVSLRIGVPVPPGRKLTLPFSFAYDSTGSYFVEPAPAPNYLYQIGYNLGPLADGGWSYSVPQLSRFEVQYAKTLNSGGTSTCNATTGYVFIDPSGTRHNLGLSHIYNYYGSPNKESTACLDSGYREYATGGDSVYRAALVGTTTGNSSYAGPGDGTPTVADPDGAVYTFSGWGCNNDQPVNYGLATSIEDRNGNIINISTASGCNGFTATDTLGRTVLSASNFGASGTNTTVSVAGVGSYTLTWAPAGSNPSGLPLSSTAFGTGDPNCAMAHSAFATGPQISAIALPNGQQYQFQYDAQTGFLDKVAYPGGGYVSYTWGIDPMSSVISFQDSNGTGVCDYHYDTPAVIQAAEGTAPVRQATGNFQRVVDAGRTIGMDRTTGGPTSIYTVITRPNGSLVTAFPGKP